MPERSEAGGKLRVALFPAAQSEQPASYLALLSASLQELGVVDVGPRPVRIGWSLRQHEVDVIHLHWLEYVAASDADSLIGAARGWFRVLRLVAFLLILRLRGIGVVWTVHNLTPHQSQRAAPEWFCARAVYLLCDDVIVHSQYAASRVVARFLGRRRRPPVVIPHANYVGAFPECDVTRSEARDVLGLPENAYVYLAFGLIRSYKRLTLLTDAFTAIAGDESRLLIAGPPSQPEEVAALHAAAAADPRIIVRAEYVDDELVPVLHHAADAAVLAYADVFSSGALLLALSYGLPVVAPSGGTVGELFGAPEAEFFNGTEIGGALLRIQTGDRSRAARASADRFPWHGAAAATAAVYRRAAAGRRAAG